ncbi:hypothetical protein DEO72_LG5g2483 [Vigna unguiculata]|uniref:Uncharacterized protein n=1 Tax=Vigna unguiculata TaxID=3917 RepID=A0A4D6M0K9_VIGUN|nr:hypothetical protein DEO72_LG5g2483 [Vigna unguiculata]
MNYNFGVMFIGSDKVNRINLLYRIVKEKEFWIRSRKLRRYIQDENSRQAKAVKEAKLMIAATKEKVKCLVQRLQNEKDVKVQDEVVTSPEESCSL